MSGKTACFSATSKTITFLAEACVGSHIQSHSLISAEKKFAGMGLNGKAPPISVRLLDLADLTTSRMSSTTLSEDGRH